MEDSAWLSPDDKKKLEALKAELLELKKEHKLFASKKRELTPEERGVWKQNGSRTNEVHIEIKELRIKNILEAARG